MPSFAAVDTETTSTSPSKAKVIQAALVQRTNDGTERAFSRYFYATHIPPGAQAVHGISAEQLADCRPFESALPSLLDSLHASDYVVTYNGTGYDLQIFDAYAKRIDSSGNLLARSRALRSKHVDCFRAWKRLQAIDSRAACHSGSLAGAHLYLVGETFDGAHDATVDCRATLAVMERLAGRFGLDALVRWSNAPLPDCADMDGKFKWVGGDTLTITIGDYAGEDVMDVDPGFLRWMLRPDKDFASDTLEIVKLVLAREYPVRRYEDEDHGTPIQPIVDDGPPNAPAHVSINGDDT